jgi:hypothetical protein
MIDTEVPKIPSSMHYTTVPFWTLVTRHHQGKQARYVHPDAEHSSTLNVVCTRSTVWLAIGAYSEDENWCKLDLCNVKMVQSSAND